MISTILHEEGDNSSAIASSHKCSNQFHQQELSTVEVAVEHPSPSREYSFGSPLYFAEDSTAISDPVFGTKDDDENDPNEVESGSCESSPFSSSYEILGSSQHPTMAPWSAGYPPSTSYSSVHALPDPPSSFYLFHSSQQEALQQQQQQQAPAQYELNGKMMSSSCKDHRYTPLASSTTHLNAHSSLPQVPHEAPPCRLFEAQFLSQGTTLEARQTLRVTMANREMWKQFQAIGTEMIVTNVGRRMFPYLALNVEGLVPDRRYHFFVDMVLHEPNTLKFQAGHWVPNGQNEVYPPPDREVSKIYIHPDSPNNGRFWMKRDITFHKLKITNDRKIKNSRNHKSIFVYSMHKFIPRVYITETLSNKDESGSRHFACFYFPGTEFIAVTAYQNSDVTELKIHHNPFAKGFRDRVNPYDESTTRSFQQEPDQSSHKALAALPTNESRGQLTPPVTFAMSTSSDHEPLYNHNKTIPPPPAYPLPSPHYHTSSGSSPPYFPPLYPSPTASQYSSYSLPYPPTEFASAAHISSSPSNYPVTYPPPPADYRHITDTGSAPQQRHTHQMSWGVSSLHAITYAESQYHAYHGGLSYNWPI